MRGIVPVHSISNVKGKSRYTKIDESRSASRFKIRDGRGRKKRGVRTNAKFRGAGKHKRGNGNI